MSGSVFRVLYQLLEPCIFLWVIRVPKQYTLQVFAVRSHITRSHTSARPGALRCVIPAVRHFLLPACHASVDHARRGQKSVLCFEAFEDLPWAKMVLGVRYGRPLFRVSNPTGPEFKGMSVDVQTWLRCYITKEKERKTQTLLHILLPGLNI